MSKAVPAWIASRVGNDQMLGQMARYGVVVVSGYGLAIGLYALELSIDIAPYIALGISFVINALYNFTLIRLWAFPPSGRRYLHDLARFGLVASASFAVNYATFAILYSLIGLGALDAQRLGILIAAPVTFFASRLWAFRARDTTGPGQPPPELAPTASRNDS